MKRSIAVKVATLMFSLAALTLAIAYGCSKPPPPPQAQNAAAPNAPSVASVAPVASESAEDELNPAYLGASKAAVMVHPKSKPSTSAKNQNQK